MFGAQDKDAGASGTRRSASTMNEASQRPMPTQIKTRTTGHTVFIGFWCKRGIYPYITDNDRAGKLLKFGWV